MRIAITGASGLLGGNLAALACGRGLEVVATRRGASRAEHLAHLPIRWADADLDDVDGLTRAFAGADVVFHVAAQVSIRRRATPAMVRANVQGTGKVVAAVRAAGVPRLVHTSTTSAVGLSDDGRPCTEDSPWNFDRHGLVDGYVRTKTDAEALVRAAAADGLDAVIVNPAFLLGPLDARPSSGQLLVALAKGRVPGLTGGWNNFVDVRDVAAGMLAAAERGRLGERYILGGENLCYADALPRFARLLGVAPPRLHVPRWLSTVGGWLGDAAESLTEGEPALNSATARWAWAAGYRFSSEKAARALGYAPGPLDRAVVDAAAWLRAHGKM